MSEKKQEIDFYLMNIGQDFKGNITFTYRTKQNPSKLQTHTDESFQPYFYVLEDANFRDIFVSAKRQKLVSHYEKCDDLSPLEKNTANVIKVFCNRSYDVKKARDFWNNTYESDVMFTNRYLIDNFYNKDFADIESRKQIIDIEVLLGDDNSFPDFNEPTKEINCIGVWDSYLDKYFSFVYTKDSRFSGSFKMDENHYAMIYESEEEMLRSFLSFYCKNRPDVISNWNVQFDMRYLVKRMEVLLSKRDVGKLSPFGKYYFDEYTRGNFGSETEVRIKGVSIIDYIELYKFFCKTRKEKYSLDYISELELGENKVSWKEEYSNLDDLYFQDFRKFIEYNRVDVELVKRLEDKLKFIKNAEAITTLCKCPFEDYMTSTRLVDGLLLQESKRQNLVLPSSVRNIKQEIRGAFVKEPKKGRFEWIVSFDLNSLYPNLISTLNMSPETILPSDTEEEYNLAANGVKFKKIGSHEGFMSGIVKSLLDERKIYKDRMKECALQGDKDREDRFYYYQYALKVLANSVYGVMLNEKFRFFSKDIAEAITLSGQLSIKFIAEKMNLYLNKVILKNEKNKDFVVASDTDSIYVNIGDLLKNDDKFIQMTKKEQTEFVINLGQRLQEVINGKIIPVLCTSKFNLHEDEKQSLYMKIEVVSDVGLFLSKKRYILRPIWDEGVYHENPELKYTGVEIKRSDTSKLSKEILKEVINSILDGTENKKVNKIIARRTEEFKDADLEEIAFPIGVSKPIHKYDSLPVHIRGSIFYNKYYAKNPMEEISHGSKIKYIYVTDKFIIPGTKERTYVISFPDKCPVDRKYVDWKKMEEKIIKQKVQGIYEALGWFYPGEKRQTTLLEF